MRLKVEANKTLSRMIGITMTMKMMMRIMMKMRMKTMKRIETTWKNNLYRYNHVRSKQKSRLASKIT